MKSGYELYKFTTYGFDKNIEQELLVPEWFPKFIDNFKRWKHEISKNYNGIDLDDDYGIEIIDNEIMVISIFNKDNIDNPNWKNEDCESWFNDYITLNVCVEYNDHDEISDIQLFLSIFDSKTENLDSIKVTKDTVFNKTLKLLKKYKKS
jgi:hypothetical protein